eukprot:c1942_g1_i1 orf=217-579(+)
MLNRRLLPVFSLPEASLLNAFTLQDQRRSDGETLFGTKPSPNNSTPPSKNSLASKSHGNTTNTLTSRRLLLGAMLLQVFLNPNALSVARSQNCKAIIIDHQNKMPMSRNVFGPILLGTVF